MKPRPPPAAPPKKASSSKGGGGGGGDGEDMELDEDDLKIIQDTKKQGYCYFKRTLSDKDQKLLDAEQMKLRAVRSERGRDAVVTVVPSCSSFGGKSRVVGRRSLWKSECLKAKGMLVRPAALVFCGACLRVRGERWQGWLREGTHKK